ncbi:MAG TPA: AmmeMemoRadiSam system radical SAM enzyme, partial [Chitinispirillaceae bacterium]|nr:AmmeMemoRadiSam system radical SAM enzyme [Chitinispirillaceae bacterium]
MKTDHFPTKYWHRFDDDRIQCDVCPHYCKVREGQHGLCFIRMCHEGKIVLTSYGRSTGFAIDPVEKKPLNHFLPGVPVLSFGTAGCNLACKFCQNWDISKARVSDIISKKASPKQIAATAQKMQCPAVAFTYNEPIIFLEYAIDTAKECHKLGIKTIAVTNGYISEQAREEFFTHMDAAKVDLKGFSEEFYAKITGSHLQPVLNNLIYLKK